MTNDLGLVGPYTIFENLKKTSDDRPEFWSAREMAKTLGYSEYRHFIPVINRAKEACINSGQNEKDHFEDVLEMIELGKTATRQVQNIILSRYACYLIMQNADPSKEIVALGQTYFAIQTRTQELYSELADSEKRLYIRHQVVEQNKKLFGTAQNAGVRQFGQFNDAGYRGLYGKSLAEIEKIKGIKKGELLDRAGSVELAANLFRITQTDEKLKKDQIKGEWEATKTHNMVGGKVRQTIKDIGGVMPENLPAEKHIREILKELKHLGAIDQKQIPARIEMDDFVDPTLLTIEIASNATGENLRGINAALRKHPGKTSVAILIPVAQNKFKKISLAFTAKTSVELIQELESLKCIVTII